ncbi:hypothetical protein MMC13_006961 [Lambiella insularis]|nr:hypothetical protein [Lambiella insularis]
MAHDQAKSNIKNSRRQPPVLKDQGKRPQGIKKQQAVRKSLRLQAIHQSHKQFLPKSNRITEVHSLLLLPCRSADLIEPPQRPQTSQNPSTSSRKRKRGQGEEAGHFSSRIREQPPSKRLQTSPSSCINKKESHQVLTSDISEGIDPLQHWIETGKWRQEYFEQDSQVREDFERGKSPEEPAQGDWLQEHYTRESFLKMHAFTRIHDFLARKKSSASLRRKQSQSTLQTPSDQSSRESKSSQYNTPDYEIKLEQKGSYMREYDDIDDNDDKGKNMKTLCKTLLERDQTVPQNSLFRDDLFKKTCEKVRNRNEAIVVQDITRLIVPSAENLAIYGAKHLNILYETANEAWTSMNKYEGTLPQPDYSVGFGRSAFTQEQLNKLKPFVGELGSKVTTYFMATTRMYFPFFTCEVKCGAAALDFADRQNAQSMSVALRALVVLFRYVKREKELDREILAFSISHDHRSVRIYGHYSVIEEDKTTFYRHPIHEFSFTALDGKEKWTAHKFVKNVYDNHSLRIHKLICSGIDDLPAGINFDLSQSASFSQFTSQSSQQSNAESIMGEDDSQSSLLASQEVTPTTSFAQATEPAFKKPRNRWM